MKGLVRIPGTVGLLLLGVFGCTPVRGDRVRTTIPIPAAVSRALDSVERRKDAVELPWGCRRIRGLAALGTRARAVAICSVHPSAGPRQLNAGGMRQRKYAILFEEGGVRSYAHTDAHLGRSFAPVDDWQSALALAALRYPLWETFGDAPSWEDTLRWRQIVDPFPVPEVVASGEDWIVRWPVLSFFGCDHDLWLAEIRVSRDGSTKIDPLATRRLAIAEADLCVD